jgi:GNAT superfamily N-acetyltransferase
MQGNELRRATPADANVVRELSRAAYAKWVPLIGREPLPMTADYDRAIAQHIIDLLEEGGQLLALVEMIPQKDHLLIENIAVRPDQQGKGFGDLLLQHVEGIARSLGFEEMQLYTNAAFTSNIAFYAKRGYDEHRRGTIVPGTTTVFMRKRISSFGGLSRDL